VRRKGKKENERGFLNASPEWGGGQICNELRTIKALAIRMEGSVEKKGENTRKRKKGRDGQKRSRGSSGRQGIGQGKRKTEGVIGRPMGGDFPKREGGVSLAFKRRSGARG